MRLAANPATRPLRVTAVHRTGAAEWMVLAVTALGAFNWGLVGAFDLDLVSMLFGQGTVLARLAYLFIGSCAVCAVGAMLKRNADD